MYYTGIDVHPKRSQFQMLDEDGALGLTMNVPTTIAGFEQYFSKLDAPTRVTFEASCCYWWVHEHLTHHPQVVHTTVVDPRRSRRLSEELSVQRGYGRAKNDRIDTEMMAEQDRLKLAPAIHVPTAEQLRVRSLNRHRFLLVYDRTAARNRIYGLLCLHGAIVQTAKFVDDPEYRTRQLQTMPDYVHFLAAHQVAQIELFTKQVHACEKE